MEKTEIFKDIYGYEGLYQISNFGNVKSADRERLGRGGSIRKCPGRILKPKINNKGYYQVDLFNSENKSKRFLIHRLVAETFLDNSNNYDQINHIDNDHTNNHVDNLEWCTNEYNCTYGTHVERVTEQIRVPIYSIDENGNIENFPGVREARRQMFERFGKYGNISAVLCGRQKTSLGRQWFYAKSA